MSNRNLGQSSVCVLVTGGAFVGRSSPVQQARAEDIKFRKVKFYRSDHPVTPLSQWLRKIARQVLSRRCDFYESSILLDSVNTNEQHWQALIDYIRSANYGAFVVICGTDGSAAVLGDN